MYKKMFLLIFFLFFSACSSNNVLIFKNNERKIKKEKSFEYIRPKISQNFLKTLKNIIKDMSNNHLSDINKKYIHPSFGLYNVSKLDGIKTFTFQNQIYNVVESPYDEFSQLIKRLDKNILKEKLQNKNVNFNCSPNDDAFYGWNKYGVFFSNKTKDYLLPLMQKENKIHAKKYKKQDFHKAKIIEKTSYKVIITPEIVFYLTAIKNKWYITLIDRITTDCSSSY